MTGVVAECALLEPGKPSGFAVRHPVQALAEDEMVAECQRAVLLVVGKLAQPFPPPLDSHLFHSRLLRSSPPASAPLVACLPGISWLRLRVPAVRGCRFPLASPWSLFRGLPLPAKLFQLESQL